MDSHGSDSSASWARVENDLDADNVVLLRTFFKLVLPLVYEGVMILLAIVYPGRSTLVYDARQTVAVPLPGEREMIL